MIKKKPELLLPAGNVESFRAAIHGGADAVYLGLQQFNARIRANNFRETDLPAIMQEARKNGVKVYITLNTVIKNQETGKLTEFLDWLEKMKVDGIIFQDWGVFYLAKKYFPGLRLHASTQLGTHNSNGVIYASQTGISRVVLARELIMHELESIASNSTCELEVFIHGALCYSFSGQCFFSSYIGGRGANRGLCSQPCRMVYEDGGQPKYLFSLKDNQQLEVLQKFSDLGIHSLKVEGRMKSSGYVFQVAKAYRLAIDNHPKATNQAREMLGLDFGRSKSGYFYDKNLKNAMAETSNTGIRVGNIIRMSKKEVVFTSSVSLKNGDRLRIRHLKDENTFTIKVQDLWEDNGQYSFIYEGDSKLFPGDEVFWIGRKEQSFPSRLPKVESVVNKIPARQQAEIIRNLIIKNKQCPHGLYVRVGSPGWLNQIRFGEADGFILSFGREDLESFDFSSPDIQQNRHKIYIELPKFISELQIRAWESLIRKIQGVGICRFFISHLSQKLLTGNDSIILSNEQVYVFNDAAARHLFSQKIKNFCYPVENDFENLRTMQNKQGIILLHTYPELFYSRMPVKIEDKNGFFRDDHQKKYRRIRKDGMTIVVPDQPVNLFQYKKRLTELGFNNFMLDLKHHEISENLWKKLIKKYNKGEQVMPSGIFNFKKGLL